MHACPMGHGGALSACRSEVQAARAPFPARPQSHVAEQDKRVLKQEVERLLKQQ